jgi:hypothetical protein
MYQILQCIKKLTLTFVIAFTRVYATMRETKIIQYKILFIVRRSW